MIKSRAEKWLQPDGLVPGEGWARDGLIDVEIAKKMGITKQTLNTWKKKYSKLREKLKDGKEVVDTKVENALLKRALGYKTEEIIYKHGVEVERIVKEVQPDTTAQIFWLKNRRPDKWRDRPKNQYLEEMNAEVGVIEINAQLELDEGENVDNSVEKSKEIKETKGKRGRERKCNGGS